MAKRVDTFVPRHASLLSCLVAIKKAHRRQTHHRHNLSRQLRVFQQAILSSTYTLVNPLVNQYALQTNMAFLGDKDHVLAMARAMIASTPNLHLHVPARENEINSGRAAIIDELIVKTNPQISPIVIQAQANNIRRQIYQDGVKRNFAWVRKSSVQWWVDSRLCQLWDVDFSRFNAEEPLCSVGPFDKNFVIFYLKKLEHPVNGLADAAAIIQGMSHCHCSLLAEPAIGPNGEPTVEQQLATLKNQVAELSKTKADMEHTIQAQNQQLVEARSQALTVGRQVEQIEANAANVAVSLRKNLMNVRNGLCGFEEL